MASRSATYHYLKTSFKLKLLKFGPAVLPLIMDQKCIQVDLAKAQKRQSILDWVHILFSDEMPFELFQVPNRQNDQVWANSISEVWTVQAVQDLLKILVWGMLSYRHSELEVSLGQTVTADYCVIEGLVRTAVTRQWSRKNGPPI